MPLQQGTKTSEGTVNPQRQVPYVPTVISLWKIKILSLGPPCLEL